MPVFFYIDAAMGQDRNCKDVKHINLGYTFFPIDMDEEEEKSEVDSSASNDETKNAAADDLKEPLGTIEKPRQITAHAHDDAEAARLKDKYEQLAQKRLEEQRIKQEAQAKALAHSQALQQQQQQQSTKQSASKSSPSKPQSKPKDSQ